MQQSMVGAVVARYIPRTISGIVSHADTEAGLDARNFETLQIATD